MHTFNQLTDGARRGGSSFALVLANILAGPALIVGVLSAPAFAQIDQAVFRADDGTAYQVVRLDLTPGVDHVRITTIGSGTQGNGGCNLSLGMSGEAGQAIAGVLPPS